MGGILPQCLHAGFGLTAYGQELTGPEYMARLAEKLADTGVVFLPGTVVLSVSEERIAVLSRRGAVEQLRFERMILATGCRERSIGSLPVAGTRPAGIFTAGQAQERINLRRQDLGGGNVISSVITMSSIRELGLKVGGTAYAVIKASNVMIGVDD